MIVSPGPERQQVTAARAAQADQKIFLKRRLHRLEEEVRRLRESFGEKRLVVDTMSRDFLPFTTWVVGRLKQLLDASDVTYPRSEYGISWFTDTAYQLPV
ncbi:hypothetical protein Tco_1170235 [Tanacetum coccineum]